MDDKFLDRIADELSLDNLLSLEERDALPEQEEDGEKKSGRDGEGTSKSQKSNAERLRKHRQKKKLERVEMYEENKVLKGERQEYLRKIADLELEVESLRGQGVMDLSRENELLRAEIKKHEEYIERVVDVVLKTPIQTDEVENRRLLHNYVESGTARVVGLAYSSIHSDLWTKAKPYSLQITDEIVLENVQTWYQYLPIGTSVKEAKRVNIRTEIPAIPGDWRKLGKAHWSVISTQGASEEGVKPSSEKKGINMEHLGPVIQLSETESVVRACWKDGELGSKLAVFVAAYKETEMYPIAFDETMNPQPNSPAQPVAVVHLTSCDPSDRFIPKNNITISGDSTYAYLFRKCADGECAITHIETTTLTGSFYDLIVRPVLDDEDHISSDGVVHMFNQLSQASRLRKAFELCENADSEAILNDDVS